MARLWHSFFANTYWYRYRWRQVPEAKPFVDIELPAHNKPPRRVDSGISIGTNGFSSSHTTLKQVSDFNEPIFLVLDFEDGPCVKSLDYGTFSHWEAMEALLLDLEKDGIAVGELWDQTEKMRICRGDWDARARPGWSVCLHCQDVQAAPDIRQNDNDEIESYEEEWIDEVLDHYQEDWCLPRWRIQVEQERSIRKPIQEPSWIMVALGCASVVFFIVAVIVYTA
ncbi:hypothetical protein E8E13_003820 [Curvularia kusanoi]|uniref:Uncharacterized protein n=1 Tax=Curvularia kusanoi TaxID=90978 RepID=A0A9P4W4A7_CURKU|nr:hypothetical protein E8E13_003820 [Curvularia kusanoi]